MGSPSAVRAIYLVQGDGSFPAYGLPPNSDYLYLQWQQDFQPMENSFHFPNSTWASGRNELYRRARIQGEYDYFIFLDDDLTFDPAKRWKRVARKLLGLLKRLRPLAACRLGLSVARQWRDPNIFEAFETLLLANGSLIATPRDWDHAYNSDCVLSEVDAITQGEHNFIAIHHSIADAVLPYDVTFAEKNWWLCCDKFYHDAAAQFHGRIHRYSNLHVWNQEAREYPRSTEGRYRVVNKVSKAICQPHPGLVPISPSTPLLDSKTAIVVTSIANTTAQLRAIGERRQTSEFRFVLIGDAKSPAVIDVPGAEFLSLDAQLDMPFELAKLLPRDCYARKCLGYLVALQDPKVSVIVETDDDNQPLSGFWQSRQIEQEVDVLEGAGWANAYHYFCQQQVWPRGFPLRRVNDRLGAKHLTGRRRDPDAPTIVPAQQRTCLLQQGLVQHDPDIDAIFRLTHQLPVWFQPRTPIYLSPGLWCPTNSQNTTWSVDIAPLLYLPSFCPMRETDIWRGIVAQRVLWSIGAGVMFHQATMLQVRNDHNLMRDFKDEARLYTMMEPVTETLAALDLGGGYGNLGANLRRCYSALVELGIVAEEEMVLLEAWLNDVAGLMASRSG